MTSPEFEQRAGAQLAAAALTPTRAKPLSYWQLVWWRLVRGKVTAGAALVILVIVSSAIFAPWLTPYSPIEGQVRERLLPIGSPGHILGTEGLGRDMLTRILYGGRVSLLTGILPIFGALAVGSVLGIGAGYLGGWANMLVMRFIDIFYAFPVIILAIAIAAALGPGVDNTMIALAIVFIPPITRVTETVAVQVKGMEFVEAARASGASTFQVARVHLVPNVLGPIFVYSSTLVSVSIIAASGLSFLGLGVSPPTADWGLMLNELRVSMYVQPWVSILPGVMIFVIGMAFNLFSDGLRDAMDVRM